MFSGLRADWVGAKEMIFCVCYMEGMEDSLILCLLKFYSVLGFKEIIVWLHD